MTSNPASTVSGAQGTRFPVSRLLSGISRLSILNLVLAICAIHIALLIWQAYLVQVNNDGIHYVRVANLLAQGHFAEARAIYPWLGYPLLISGVIAATGLDGMTAARLLNGLASTATVLLILRSVWVVLPGRTPLL